MKSHKAIQPGSQWLKKHIKTVYWDGCSFNELVFALLPFTQDLRMFVFIWLLLKLNEIKKQKIVDTGSERAWSVRPCRLADQNQLLNFSHDYKLITFFFSPKSNKYFTCNSFELIFNCFVKNIGNSDEQYVCSITSELFPSSQVLVHLCTASNQQPHFICGQPPHDSNSIQVAFYRDRKNMKVSRPSGCKGLILRLLCRVTHIQIPF